MEPCNQHDSFFPSTFCVQLSCPIPRLVINLNPVFLRELGFQLVQDFLNI